ncbi:hypothetical protein NDU88_004066 [Pleurodeles waltl]|uniref:Uncharacterized protein n=1 Tax=Pleurodeles waltl TaxID=8319 RepID=A0AAV7T6W9_PLEWA|nr:hypothetical protein NDU88_004066 [Pleurodeles waltl]
MSLAAYSPEGECSALKTEPKSLFRHIGRFCSRPLASRSSREAPYSAPQQHSQSRQWRCSSVCAAGLMYFAAVCGGQTPLAGPAMEKPTRQSPGAALATCESDPDGETLGSNQGFEAEEGGALKLTGEETLGCSGFWRTGRADSLREQEETRDLWERRNQQRNGKPDGQRSDQEAERHCNRPRSGQSLAFSVTVLAAGHGQC